MRTFGALLTTLALLSAGSRAAEWCPPPSDPSPPDRSVICSLGDPTSCPTTECHENVLFRFDIEEGKETTCEKGPAVGDTGEDMCFDFSSYPKAEDTESCKKFCDNSEDCKAYAQMKMANTAYASCYVLNDCSTEDTSTCSMHSDCRSETKCASETPSPDCLKPKLTRVDETAKWSCIDRFDEKCNLYETTLGSKSKCRVGTKCSQTPSCKTDKEDHLCTDGNWNNEDWEAQECDCRPLYIYAEPGLSLLCLQPDEPHTENEDGTLTINGKQVYKVEKGNCLLYCDGHEIHRIHCDQTQSKWIDPADLYEGPFFCWHKPNPPPECMEDTDCDENSDLPKCDTATGTCVVECSTSADCQEDGKPICKDNHCKECENDEECSAKNSDLPKCGTDTATGTCVECNDGTADCPPDNPTCTDHSCGP